MDFHVTKIKGKFATLQTILTLIGAIYWILHRVVQLWMESHVSVSSMVFL
jgi:flagellar biogenesis protein FliO